MPNQLLCEDSKRKRCVQKTSVLTHNSPATLFEVAVNFVADHIDAVEHLRSIPELIGKTLFNRVLSRNPELVTGNVLALFLNSYGHVVVSSLNLSKCNMGSYATQLIVFLPWIKDLDLSGCDVVSDEQIMCQLGNLQLPRLERLALQENSLDDHHLRCLTMPATMFGRGPVNLKELHLAGNLQLTVLGLRHVQCFKKLKILQFSWAENESTLRGLIAYLDMELVITDERLILIQTVGWAASLFSLWKSSSSCSSSLPCPPSTEEAKKFYGTRISKSHLKLQTDQVPCVTLKKTENPHKLMERSQPKHSANRKVASTETDDDLMLSYLQYRQPSPKKTTGFWGE